MVCAHTDTVYKEWLIPPQYNGLPLYSQPTTLACQVSSPYLTSLPLSVLLVVTTQYPQLWECKAPSGTSLSIGYEPWVSVFWTLLPLSSLHAYSLPKSVLCAHSKDALLSLWHKVNCWIVFVTFDKMPNIFPGSSIVFVLSHAMFYVCLTLLALIGSLVQGNPWYTIAYSRFVSRVGSSVTQTSQGVTPKVFRLRWSTCIVVWNLHVEIQSQPKLSRGTIRRVTWEWRFGVTPHLLLSQSFLLRICSFELGKH